MQQADHRAISGHSGRKEMHDWRGSIERNRELIIEKAPALPERCFGQCGAFSRLLFGKLKNFRHFGENFIIVFAAVRAAAERAVLDPVRQEAGISTAAIRQRVERTITKQTVEILFLRRGMAGKILAGAILVKCIGAGRFFHINLRFEHRCGRRS